VAEVHPPGRHDAHQGPGHLFLPGVLPYQGLPPHRHPHPHGLDRRERRTLFEVPYFDLGTAYLAQTGQLYLEAACAAFGKVYNFGPTFRAEKSKTRRHLTEFWMLEAEVAFLDNDGNMVLQEDMVSHVVSGVLANCREELALLERDVKPLENVKPPFYRVDYGEAVKKLNAAGSKIAWGDDLGGEDETILTKMYDKPIFVTNYPKQAKAFYMKENPANPATVLCSDSWPRKAMERSSAAPARDILEKLVARIKNRSFRKNPTVGTWSSANSARSPTPLRYRP